jgi:hypothetical protein
MGNWASLGGVRIISGSVCIPYRGIWDADVVLSTTTVLPSLSALTIGDLTMGCAVTRQVAFAGQTSARLVGGTAGWRKNIGSRSYQKASGVPLAFVLGDAASDCGEIVSPLALATAQNISLGAFAIREAGPAGRTVLRQWCEPLWWVDQNGMLQLGDRATTPASGNPADVVHLGPVTSKFDVEQYFEGKNKFRIATEAVSDWMPGRTFSNAIVTVPQTVSLVTHLFNGDGWHRADVLVSDQV